MQHFSKFPHLLRPYKHRQKKLEGILQRRTKAKNFLVFYVDNGFVGLKRLERKQAALVTISYTFNIVVFQLYTAWLAFSFSPPPLSLVHPTLPIESVLYILHLMIAQTSPFPFSRPFLLFFSI